MAHLKPLPIEVFKRLKEDIEKTHVNKELVQECKAILKKLIEEKERK